MKNKLFKLSVSVLLGILLVTIIGCTTDENDNPVTTPLPITIIGGGGGGGMANPMSSLGDIIVGGANGSPLALTGDTSNTDKFLRSLSIAGVAQAPSWQSVTKSDVGLSNVENTALSTWTGSTALTTLGTVTTGTLSGVTIQGSISSGTGLTFGNFSAGTITGALSGNATTATSAGSVTGLSVTAAKTLTVSNSMTLTATDGSTLAIGTGGTLGTAAYTSSGAYSPLAGSSSIVTVGTVTTGTWNGGIIGGTYGGTGINNGAYTITLNGSLTIPTLDTGYLYYNLGTGLWSFAAGGGISSIGATTPTSLTGILTGNGSTVSSVAAIPTANGGVPTGGTANQVLSKIDGTDYNTQWSTPSAGGSSTVLHALVDIQVVPANTVSVTTCTSNASFYEPAAQAHLTSNAVYKRNVVLKVSAQSNTAGTISIQLYNVTQGTAGTPATVVIAAGQQNVEKAIAIVEGTATNLGDVFTIRVKHSVNGATVTLDSGGMAEGDTVNNDISATGVVNLLINPTGEGYISAVKYVALAGFSTASITMQPVLVNSTFGNINIGSPSSLLNTSITMTTTGKVYGTFIYQINVTALSGQVDLVAAYGISADNQ